MEDAKTVRYVSKDPIQNLKIRVTLWRLSVQRSRVQLNNPNAGGAGQPQDPAQVQAQAQAQGGVQQPQPVPQPLPLPPSQPAYGPDGQPLPAAGPAAGPYPGPQVQTLPAQQQAQYVDPQAQSQAQYVGQQPQQLQEIGPQAGQAVAESFDMAEVRPSARPLDGQRPANAGRAGGPTRQRMSVQQRLNAAASGGGLSVPPAPGAGVGSGAEGPWGRGQMAVAGAYNAAPVPLSDPFGGWAEPSRGRGAVNTGPAPYGQSWRQGQPLGEAVEYPGGGGDPDGEPDALPRRGRQRRQQVAMQAAAQAAGDPPAMQPQEQQQQQQQQAPTDPQQSQPQQQQQLQEQQPGAAQPQPQVLQPQPQIGLEGILVPPQVVPQVVPYGSLGPEARMAATGEPPEVPPTTPQHELPEKFKTSRVFGWQEKVYSRNEVAAAQVAAVQAAQAGGAAVQNPGGAATGTDPAGQQQAPPQQQQAAGTGAGEPQQQQQAQPGAAGQAGQPGQPQQQQQQPPRSKRTMAFGSQSALNHKQMDPRTRGSILFTFVQTDDFCVEQELGRTITTSLYEEENMLVTKLLSNPKSRAQVITFRSMYIVADLGEETDTDSGNEKVLVSIRAFPDGSFDMCPGFSKAGFKYRFEDKHGGIFEYIVENASATDVPSLEKRTAKLERAVVARAEELRRAALKSDFEQPPSADCTRMLLLGEIQAAADFPRDRLYIEYVVRWDPETWDLTSDWPQPEPGIAQGVTHISRVTVYPADPITDTPARDVAHFAHPLELEWVSKEPPGGNAYPCIFFQVCTMDKFNRYTSEGYGWLSLDGRVPGSGTHVVRTWKPLGTIRDRQAEFFVGGSPELADLAYLTTPSGFNGKILNKYGFKTESIGSIKVRINTVTQRFNPDAAALAALRRSGALPGALRGGSPGAALKKNSKKDLSLKMVVERARQRLREARGTDQLPGTDVGVRPGLVSEMPTIVVQPQDAVVAEDSTVRFKVVARGLPPLKYEWYKDDRRLLVATSDQPELVLVQAALDSEGAYYCQVSNKDGSVNSSKATLTVTRAARVSRTMAAGGAETGRTPRRPQRSPTGSVSGSQIGPRGGARISRLSRLDAAAARSGTGASVAGSDVGGQLSPTTGLEGGPASLTSAGPSPRVSGAGGAPLGGPGAPRPLPSPPLSPPAGGSGAIVSGDVGERQPAAEATALEPLPALPAPQFPAGAPAAGGAGFPSAVAAAAASGFQRRGSRLPSAGGVTSGSSGGGAAAAPASAAAAPAAAQQDAPVVEEVVEEVVAVATGMPRQRRRMPSSSDPPPVPQQRPQPQIRPPPRRNDDDDDLDAEEID